MKKKLLVIIIVAAVIVGIGSFLIAELPYYNWVSFRLPLDCSGRIIIRNDGRGDGDFGARRNGHRKHAGIDFLAEVGTPVTAVRSGVVINAENKRGLGNYVEIRHPPEYITIYAHLSKLYVKQGERVRQGQCIGEVGKTGNANYKIIRPHLHFEARKDCAPQDPKRLFEGVVFIKQAP